MTAADLAALEVDDPTEAADQLDRIEAKLDTVLEVAEQLAAAAEPLAGMLQGGGSPMAMLGAMMRGGQ